MRTWKMALALGGLSVLSLSIVIPYLPRIASTSRYDGASTQIEINGGFDMPTACPSCWANDELIVKYPSTVQVDQSASVEVRLNASGPLNAKIEHPEKASSHFESELLGLNRDPSSLRAPLSLTLSSAGLQVAPSSKLEKPAGSPLPLLWRWTILATKEGTQEAILDMESLSFQSYEAGNMLRGLGRTHLRMSVNGEEVQTSALQDLRSQILRIEVLTKEGLPIQMYLVLRYAIGLLGAILVYPAVASIISE